MTNNNNNNYLLLLLLLIPIFKKKTTRVIIDPLEDAKFDNAEYLVLIRKDAKFYDRLDKKTVRAIAGNQMKLDGYKTDELPTWLLVKNGTDFFYVKMGDFKIL
jgi:hypothetical protein